MVVLGGAQPDDASALNAVTATIGSGAALDVFRRMVEHQGGDPRVVDDAGLLPSAPSVSTVRARRRGAVSAIRAGAIGRASHALGAGRSRVGDAIDHAVGARLLVDRGDAVAAGDALVELHHRDGRGLDVATALCEDAFVIADDRVEPVDRIMAEVR